MNYINESDNIILTMNKIDVIIKINRGVNLNTYL
jgi:hypothetical protein